MKTVLKSKRAYTNEQVTKVWANITEYVSETEAWDAVDQAARETRHVCGPNLDRVVYAWSGGKDSQALRVVMERAGVRRSLIGTIPHLEWLSYMGWLANHQPDGIRHIRNNDVDLHWLARNDRYLFPTNSKDGYKWTLMGTRMSQNVYQERFQPLLQIHGRRTADGNNIPPTPYGTKTTRNGTVYNPIRTWSHELTLAVVHYANMPLPPIYNEPDGWKTGTGTWSGRRVGDREASWAQTYTIEPDRVREAAQVVPSARDWMERNHPEDL